MVFQCINIRQVPWEVLKTAAFGYYKYLEAGLRDKARLQGFYSIMVTKEVETCLCTRFLKAFLVVLSREISL